MTPRRRRLHRHGHLHLGSAGQLARSFRRREPSHRRNERPVLSTGMTWVIVAVSVLSRSALSTIVALMLWSLLPSLVGFQTTTVKSGSMEPRLQVGDAIVVRPIEAAQAARGQVILFDDPDHPGKPQDASPPRDPTGTGGSSRRATRTRRKTPRRSVSTRCTAPRSSGSRSRASPRSGCARGSRCPWCSAAASWPCWSSAHRRADRQAAGGRGGARATPSPRCAAARCASRDHGGRRAGRRRGRRGRRARSRGGVQRGDRPGREHLGHPVRRCRARLLRDRCAAVLLGVRDQPRCERGRPLGASGRGRTARRRGAHVPLQGARALHHRRLVGRRRDRGAAGPRTELSR